MKSKFRINPKIVKRVVLLILLFAVVGLFGSVIVRSFDDGHILSDSTLIQDFELSGEYKDYLDSKPQSFPEGKQIVISGADFVDEKTSDDFYVVVVDEQPALYTSELGDATWNLPITEAGFYTIMLSYYPELGGGSNIERSIKIDGEVPFPSLRTVIFQRVWGDRDEVVEDMMGNHMKPVQEEKPEIRHAYVRDDLGLVTEPYLIYLEAGMRELTLSSRRENMSIVSITIGSREEFKTYAEAKAEYEANNYPIIGSDVEVYTEAEDAQRRSSPTLYAVSDRTSAFNSPADPVKIKFNSIGGSKWVVPGDWIEWDVEVPQSGLYQISMRAKQNANRGMFSTRKVYINGEVPFEEAANSKFAYSANWNVVTLGSDTEPYYFYLEAGVNRITMEVTLGDYGSSISRVQNTIDDLNALYRAIIQRTGINPDPYQDYFLTDQIPHMLDTFARSAETLREVAENIASISGEKSDKTASLDRMSIQLEDFVKNHRTIQRRLGDFNNNISALGTWLLDIREQPLLIDWISVHGNDFALPKANPNFFVGFWFQTRAFFQSFFFDYSAIGTTSINENNPSIEVWFLTSAVAGREQANALRILIDETFGEDIVVDLRVVQPYVLLPATLAGRGPDVAINVDNGLPVNYALRNAIHDLSTFSDFEEITDRFKESAMVPYEFNGGYFALPNTQSFLVLFYREDIFAERGWTVPQTWDEVKSFIPDLQKDNLQFYLPVNTILANSVVNPIFASMLFQRDGSFYRNGNMESNFDTPISMEVFDFWTDFYTSYSFPLAANFLNRFRSGEMPIGIANYEAYNTFQVFAPEIRGKWSFGLIPGTPDQDEFGNDIIRREVGASGTAVVIMNQSEKKDESWEFLKWWTSAPTQTNYARELEAILGPAARHTTANVEAFQNLPWSVEERAVLMEQWSYAVGIPEVAGGYYTGRNLENAFREVVNKNKYPREILADYIVKINAEITKKRLEFGLPVAE